eukprot:13601-Heterococcus_DN1.PRE.1
MSTGTNSVYNCAVCSHWLAAVPLRAGTVSHTELHALCPGSSILLSDAVTSLTAVKCVTERSLQPVMIDVSTLYVLLFAQLQLNTNCEGAVVLRCCGVLVMCAIPVVMLDYNSCDVGLHTLAACQVISNRIMFKNCSWYSSGGSAAVNNNKTVLCAYTGTAHVLQLVYYRQLDLYTI